MTLNNIVNLINKKLAGELLTYNEVIIFLDNTIDDINSQLNSCYPAFSELDSSVSDYNYFPDKYIRSVVVPGAVWYFYVMDEEGMQTAPQYSADYSRGMFTMLRDHLYNVPVEYQADSHQGNVEFTFEQEEGTPGINIDIGEW